MRRLDDFTQQKNRQIGIQHFGQYFCTRENYLVHIRRVAEIQIFETTYLIDIKDETGLKLKINDSTLFLIGSYAQ